MRNPKIPFTYEYSQPEEYRFSLDSVEMAWEITEHLKGRMAEDAQLKKQSPSDYLKNQMRRWRVLDLCSGCGVIGFELNFHLPQLRQIDFLDVQEVYADHFQKNLRLVKNEGEFHFLNLNYEEMLKDPAFAKKYDLIVCNPPYFKVEQGKLSPSEFKNRCRFFIDSTFEKMLDSLEFSLAPDGEAYLLLRPLEDHGFDLLLELRKHVRGRLQCENLAMIRGTFLLKLSRHENSL